MSVSSIPELENSLKLDKGFWNLISIRGPDVPQCAAQSLEHFSS
jgi:hypothetical protein